VPPVTLPRPRTCIRSRTPIRVGHILRAAACAARIAEIDAGDDPGAASSMIEHARLRATPELVDVLRRYPAAPAAKTPVGQLITALDSTLRAIR
jgi:hypothetical protein